MSFVIEGISYFLNTPYTGEATVFSNDSAVGSIVIPPEIFDSDSNSYLVTEISVNAFKNDTNITSIVLSDGLKRIGRSAFENSIIEEINIPISVNNIGDSIFKDCASLRNVNWDSLFGDIPNNTFENCVSLASFLVPSTIYNVGGEAFKGSGITSMVLPDFITKAQASTFENCTSLTSLILPKYLSDIQYKLCKGCTALTSIIIPDFVTTIGSRAFESTGLTSIILPNNIFSVGGDFYDPGYTFANCTNLTSMTWSTFTRDIAGHMFLNCVNLASITVYSNTFAIDSTAFDGCTKLRTSGSPGLFYSNQAFGSCYNYFTDPSNGFYLTFVLLNFVEYTDTVDNVVYLCNGDNFTAQVQNSPSVSTTTLTIPSSITVTGVTYEVTSIIGQAFSGTGLTSVTVPDSVTSIGSNTFSGCSNLANVVLPSTLTVIPDGCFDRCSSLTALDFLPSTIEYIGVTAFRRCSGLVSAIIPPNVSVITGESFRFCSQLRTIVFPTSLKLISIYAFQFCTSLESLDLPDGLNYIDQISFSECSSLVTVNAPKTLLTIGYLAFSECSSLASFNFF
jgi:hypothetical protein